MRIGVFRAVLGLRQGIGRLLLTRFSFSYGLTGFVPLSATVVKLSANRRYGLSTEESDNREGETVAFIRAVIAALEREERA